MGPSYERHVGEADKRRVRLLGPGRSKAEAQGFRHSALSVGIDQNLEPLPSQYCSHWAALIWADGDPPGWPQFDDRLCSMPNKSLAIERRHQLVVAAKAM